MRPDEATRIGVLASRRPGFPCYTLHSDVLHLLEELLIATGTRWRGNAELCQHWHTFCRELTGRSATSLANAPPDLLHQFRDALQTRLETIAPEPEEGWQA